LVPIVLEVSQELSNAIMIKHQESVNNLASLANFDPKTEPTLNPLMTMLEAHIIHGSRVVRMVSP
jgi:hypothetical protein